MTTLSLLNKWAKLVQHPKTSKFLLTSSISVSFPLKLPITNTLYMSSPNPNFDNPNCDENIEPFFSHPLQIHPTDDQMPLDSFNPPPPFPQETIIGCYNQDYTNTLSVSDYNYLEDYPILSIDISTTETMNVATARVDSTNPTAHQQQDQILPNQINMVELEEEPGVGLQPSGSGGASSSSLSSVKMNMIKKKIDHNAKERNRRLQQNATYCALRSLLPETQKPKMRWSAPYIIDRTLEHIPQLEREIEELKSKKKDMQLKREKVLFEKQELHKSSVTVSMNEVRRGQVIIQICHQKHSDNDFSNLIEKLEGEEGMEILGGSTSELCKDRSCYNIHVQKKDESSLGADYLTVLKEKVLLWLMT